MYIYESHLGGLYVDFDYRDYEALYCEQCGDSDQEIGYAENKGEAWELLKEHTDLFDEAVCENCPHNGDSDYCDSIDNNCENIQAGGGYDYEYVQEFINTNWDE